MRFKALFHELFEEYSKTLPKPEAGAKALKDAQTMLTNKIQGQSENDESSAPPSGAAKSSEPPSGAAKSPAPPSALPSLFSFAESGLKVGTENDVGVKSPAAAVSAAPAVAAAAVVAAVPELSVSRVKSLLAECKTKNEATSLIRAVGSFFCNDER